MKTVQVPATTREVAVRVTCDLCGGEIVQMYTRVDEVTVEYRRGDDFGSEGGHIITTKFDVCGSCWLGRVAPWLLAQLAPGAWPRETETEY